MQTLRLLRDQIYTHPQTKNIGDDIKYWFQNSSPAVPDETLNIHLLITAIVKRRHCRIQGSNNMIPWEGDVCAKWHP
jgi:hypothetical protein